MNPYQLVTPPVPLPDHAVLAVRGPDARRFLQGQLTQDLRRLEPGRNLPAGLLTPQGRVLALLVLQADGAEDVLLILPASLAAPVRDVLRRYVLRARLVLSGPEAGWQVCGGTDSEGPRLSARRVDPATPGAAAAVSDAELGRWQESRLAAGWPLLSPASSGQHVAQMLNLDALGALSFDKGCYTGQEIVARAHYLGRVKRRLRRLQAPAGSAVPAAGERVPWPGVGDVEVVEAVDQGPSGVAVLAVAPPVPGSEVDERDALGGQGPAEEDRADAREAGHAIGGPEL